MPERLTIKVNYKTIERLKKDYESQLRIGGMFIGSDTLPPLYNPVDLQLTLPFHHEPFTISGRVIRLVTDQEAKAKNLKPGFVIEFSDFQKIRERLGEIIENIEGKELPRTTPIILGPPPDIEKPPPDEPLNPDPEDQVDPERIEHRATQIRNMHIKEKMMLAAKANKLEREILLRDLSPSVARLLIRNPRITDMDVLRMARDVSTPADVLDAIGKNRKWIQNVEIRLAVVKNPRTPPPLAHHHLMYLPTKDLSQLAKSQHVRDSIKREALSLLLKRRDAGK